MPNRNAFAQRNVKRIGLYVEKSTYPFANHIHGLYFSETWAYLGASRTMGFPVPTIHIWIYRIMEADAIAKSVSIIQTVMKPKLTFLTLPLEVRW